ncbi:MAG: uracil-DNA glycosylase [Deltaproteobacteria bacterium]|nr:uracil-DNA glycosylase [Deltaproteobacteria bacterium]
MLRARDTRPRRAASRVALLAHLAATRSARLAATRIVRGARASLRRYAARVTTLAVLTDDITSCRRCRRLVRCREAAAADVPKRFAGQTYWRRPVPGFGDPRAALLVLGLAPAAHGANRTGRIFTGDRSGDWLYGALHRAGYANQPASTGQGDGLALRGAYVTCVVRCAPPDNKPSPAERDRCVKFLVRELALLEGVRTVVALGGFAWDGFLAAARALDEEVPRPKPAFGHGAEARVGRYALVGSYHVSQQNTFTGKLTEPMLDAVFARARELSAASP